METLDPECKKTKIKNINQGTYFKLKPTTTAPVWVRGEYERSLGKYSCFKFDDTNPEKFMKGSQDIYILTLHFNTCSTYSERKRKSE